MSQTYRTPEKEPSCKLVATSLCKSSTPYAHVSRKCYSISLSGIDTCSSSSDSKSRKRLQSQVREKRIKNPKKKRRTNSKRHAAVQSRDTDSEWETRSEESVNESLIDSTAISIPTRCDDYDTACYNLFEDPCTPEKTRDATILHKHLIESPILRVSRGLRLIAEKDDIVQRDELLPVEDLPSTIVRDINLEDTNEDSPIFEHERNVKVYPPARGGITRRKEKIPEQNPRNFAFRMQFPIGLSDLLWDEFIEKNRDDIAQNLALSSARAPIQLNDSVQSGLLLDVSEKRIVNSIPPNMVCVRGYSDKDSRKWITYNDGYDFEVGDELGSGDKRKRRIRKSGKRMRKTTASKTARKRPIDIYDQFEDTDNEYEITDRDSKRMSLSEFCYKQRVIKEKLPSVSSNSDT